MKFMITILTGLVIILSLFPVLTDVQANSQAPQKNMVEGIAYQPSLTLGNLSMSSKPTQPTWVWYGSEQSYPGYQRVFVGNHKDGSSMYSCRAEFSDGLHPGKLYHDKCYIAWSTNEFIIGNDFQVLLTDAPAHLAWKPVSSLSPENIKDFAAIGGSTTFQGGRKYPLYICRVSLTDGVHAGKYAQVNNTCYVGWGGKSRSYTKDFSVLMTE
jgi:hypothetical protein